VWSIARTDLKLALAVGGRAEEAEEGGELSLAVQEEGQGQAVSSTRASSEQSSEQGKMQRAARAVSAPEQ
jgi:hypothetical protein